MWRPTFAIDLLSFSFTELSYLENGWSYFMGFLRRFLTKGIPLTITQWSPIRPCPLLHQVKFSRLSFRNENHCKYFLNLLIIYKQETPSQTRRWSGFCLIAIYWESRKYQSDRGPMMFQKCALVGGSLETKFKTNFMPKLVHKLKNGQPHTKRLFHVGY